MDETEQKIKEYEQVCETLRHYSGLRFVVFPVFLAFVGGDVAFIYAKEAPPCFVVIAAKLAGVLGTFVFWFIEIKSNIYINLLEDRASDLERLLGYNNFINRAKIENGEEPAGIKQSPLPFQKIVGKLQVWKVLWPMYLCVFIFWILLLLSQILHWFWYLAICQLEP